MPTVRSGAEKKARRGRFPPDCEGAMESYARNRYALRCSSQRDIPMTSGRVTPSVPLPCSEPHFVQTPELLSVHIKAREVCLEIVDGINVRDRRLISIERIRIIVVLMEPSLEPFCDHLVIFRNRL